MPKTDSIPSTPTPDLSPPAAKPSRRGVLASAAGLLALGAVRPAGGASSPAHPDAGLIALCEEYTALDRAFIANTYATADLTSDAPEYDALMDEGGAMVPRLHELRTLIAATPPHTARGRLAKLEAARRLLMSNADDPDSDLMDRDAELPLAAIEEMLAHLGRGA